MQREDGSEEMSDLARLAEALNLEDQDGGDGNDSDIEGEEYELHELDPNETISDQAVEAVVEEKDGTTVSIHRMSTSGWIDISSEDMTDVKVPKQDPDWSPPPRKASKGEPEFRNIDNPGDWDEFCFRPKFNKGRGSYIGHQLPTGAMPVPKGEDGKRKEGRWEFHYKGFENEEKRFRRGATTSNLFPKEMEGSLDGDILKKLGLSKERMQNTDALFFFQLLLPFCDPSKSGVEDDPRIAYYTEVEKFTNASKFLTGTGVSYGHEWSQTSAAELLCHDGILVQDGVLGGSDGALYQRWDTSSPMYSSLIANSMTLTRYGELKRNKKLCVNISSPKPDQPGYDPAYKYDLIYKTLVHNTNAISKKADENQVLDESTWGHGGFGEAGSGITTRLMNKKVSKGGQVVFMMDRFRMRIRAYMHRHKLYKKIYKGERDRWGKNGTFELFYLSTSLLKMVQGVTSDDKKIFEEKPCITADNYFQDDSIMNWLGEQGLGGIMTSARDRLPSDIPSQYLHKQKTDAKHQGAKLARFVPPIVAVMTDEEKGYQRIHVSFQSTSSCNISTVNALNEVQHIVEERERGRGENKRSWVIEMNNGRRIYLSTYNGVDVLDHMIKLAKMFYRTWKYWHAPVTHGLATVIACVYDMYLECAEGELDIEWKIDNPVSYWDFRRILAQQMLTYNSSGQRYPGDGKLRAVTKLPKVVRRKVKGEVTLDQLKKAIRGRKSRGCGDLDELCRHVESVKPVKGGRRCEWCGKVAYHECTACEGSDGKPVALHFQKRGENTCMCFLNYHNDVCVGLGRGDSTKLMGATKKDWKEPTKTQRRANRAHILNLKKSNGLK